MVVRRFSLPANRENPPACSIGKQLKAVDASDKRGGILGIMSGFVGAEGLQDVSPFICVPRDLVFPDAVLFKVRAGGINKFLHGQGGRARAALLLGNSGDESAQELFAAKTPHIVFDEFQPHSPISLISIVNATRDVLL